MFRLHANVCNRMKSIALLSAFAIFSLPCIVATFPLEIPPMTSPGEPAMCVSEQLRESARQSFTETTEELISDVQSFAGILNHECGSGLWKRVAYLDMSNTSQQCPSSWREYSEVRSCGRPATPGRSCASESFSSGDFEYSQVCGRIIGYQYATPDAFNHVIITNPTIDEEYVDGISVTRGTPRTHIWTFAAGANEQEPNTGCYCGDSSTSGDPPPSFVGTNYFCESARHDNMHVGGIFYSEDPLWDGMNCPATNCCDFNTPPWFKVDLASVSTDDIDVRNCHDQGTNDEDVTIRLLEIYVA